MWSTELLLLARRIQDLVQRGLHFVTMNPDCPDDTQLIDDHAAKALILKRQRAVKSAG